MTSELEHIRAEVQAHFAAMDRRTSAYIKDPSSIESYQANYDYNSAQHAAMCLLRDVLPLLDAAVLWQTLDDDTPLYTRIKAGDVLAGKVAKLLEESEE